MRLLLPCLLLCGASSVLGARILAVLPLPGKSHFIYCQAVLSALAARGHQVTVYSPFTPPKPVANMKHVQVHTEFEKVMKDGMTFDRFAQIVGFKSYFGLGAKVVWELCYQICEEFLGHPQIKELIASKEKFDLVIAEILFGEEALLVFGHYFKAPVVNLNGFGTWSVINRIHGNALQIEHIPDTVSFPFSNKMSFEERFRTMVSTALTLYFYHSDHLPRHNAILKRVFNDPNIPPVEDMVYNISLTLANFHPMVTYSQSVTSNIVPVGGIHVASDPPPLPKDIKDFMDSAKNAVIYFSLGTVVPVHQMPSHYLQTFVNAFKKMPYKILWKIEADSVPNLPSNVKIAKWLPQQGVLAHPNCVLFITHGGLLSQHEAMYAGVPVVGIPFFGDQPHNVRVYEELGFGVKLDFLTMTEDSLYNTVMSIVGKPKIIENAKKVSTLYRHRPMSPADTAGFWVEYVLRHGGSEHLRSAAASMPWYQIFLLDIIAAIITALVLALLLLRMIFHFLWSLCCGGKGVTKDGAASKKKKQ